MTNNLTEHLELWLVDLAARGRSRATQKTYRDCVTGYLRWLDDTGREQKNFSFEVFPEISPDPVRAYLAHMSANGRSITTRLRHAALRQFSKWLAAEEILPADPLLKLPPPKIIRRWCPP